MAISLYERINNDLSQLNEKQLNEITDQAIGSAARGVTSKDQFIAQLTANEQWRKKFGFSSEFGTWGINNDQWDKLYQLAAKGQLAQGNAASGSLDPNQEYFAIKVKGIVNPDGSPNAATSAWKYIRIKDMSAYEDTETYLGRIKIKKIDIKLLDKLTLGPQYVDLVDDITKASIFNKKDLKQVQAASQRGMKSAKNTEVFRRSNGYEMTSEEVTDKSTFNGENGRINSASTDDVLGLYLIRKFKPERETAFKVNEIEDKEIHDIFVGPIEKWLPSMKQALSQTQSLTSNWVIKLRSQLDKLEENPNIDFNSKLIEKLNTLLNAKIIKTSDLNKSGDGDSYSFPIKCLLAGCFNDIKDTAAAECIGTYANIVKEPIGYIKPDLRSKIEGADDKDKMKTLAQNIIVYDGEKTETDTSIYLVANSTDESVGKLAKINSEFAELKKYKPRLKKEMLAAMETWFSDSDELAEQYELRFVNNDKETEIIPLAKSTASTTDKLVLIPEDKDLLVGAGKGVVGKGQALIVNNFVNRKVNLLAKPKDINITATVNSVNTPRDEVFETTGDLLTAKRTWDIENVQFVLEKSDKGGWKITEAVFDLMEVEDDSKPKDPKPEDGDGGSTDHPTTSDAPTEVKKALNNEEVAGFIADLALIYLKDVDKNLSKDGVMNTLQNSWLNVFKQLRTNIIDNYEDYHIIIDDKGKAKFPSYANKKQIEGAFDPHMLIRIFLDNWYNSLAKKPEKTGSNIPDITIDKKGLPTRYGVANASATAQNIKNALDNNIDTATGTLKDTTQITNLKGEISNLVKYLNQNIKTSKK